MNLSDPVSAYCERAGPGLLAEPLNALSNLAFLAAAWWLWSRLDARRPLLAGPQRVLAALIALVGLGSFAFHTLATGWAGVLDVLFIGIFNLAFLVLYVRLLARRSWRWSAAAGVAFVTVDRLAARALPEEALNGSLLYLPALLVLGLLTAHALWRAPPAGRRMAAAAGVFLVSLLLRSIDRAVCASWPWGTHFLWHLLNAWVLFELSRALLDGATDSGRGVDGPRGLAAVLDPAATEVLVQRDEVAQPLQVDRDAR